MKKILEEVFEWTQHEPVCERPEYYTPPSISDQPQLKSDIDVYSEGKDDNILFPGILENPLLDLDLRLIEHTSYLTKTIENDKDSEEEKFPTLNEISEQIQTKASSFGNETTEEQMKRGPDRKKRKVGRPPTKIDTSPEKLMKVIRDYLIEEFKGFEAKLESKYSTP